MAEAHARKYGHGDCPNCEKEFNLSDAEHYIGMKMGNDEIMFVLCRNCGMDWLANGERLQQDISRNCWQKFLGHVTDAATSTIMTRTSLIQNQCDLVRAFELGSSLPKHIHDQIFAGKADLINLGAVTVVCSEGDT